MRVERVCRVEVDLGMVFGLTDLRDDLVFLRFLRSGGWSLLLELEVRLKVVSGFIRSSWSGMVWIELCWISAALRARIDASDPAWPLLRRLDCLVLEFELR